jgi:predicted TIM-barrel fold metal-dependent hydrolase
MPAIDYPVYDADNHLYEPEEALTAHLPKKFRKDFRYVEVNGRKKLAIAGRLSDYIPNPTFEVIARPGAHETWYRAGNQEGKSLRELTGQPIECLAAYRRPEPRLELMDEQGLAGTLMFPTLASTVEVNLSYDHEVVHAVIHALNEWLFDVWKFNYQDRIFATPIITLMDVDLAVAELEYCLERGARTVLVRPAPIPGYRGGRSLGWKEFDPFWARIAEAGIFVSMHASDSGYDDTAQKWIGGSEMRPFEPEPFKLMLASSSRAISDTVAALICHGVFHRHPGVKVALVENGALWVRDLLERFDRTYGQMPQDFHEHPRETFRRHFWISPFYEEPLVELAEMIGVSQILFGSDYPHPEGLANPMDFIHELEGFGKVDQQAVMGGNLKGLLSGAGI